MDLCTGGRKHKEVCYEGVDCPVCSVIDEKKELENEIETLKGIIEKLEEGE